MLAKSPPACRHLVFAVGLLFIAGEQALAQIPGPADIQRVPERYDNPLRPLVTPEAPVMIPAPPEAVAGEDLEAVRFTLRDVQIEGNTALSDDTLGPLWADRIDTEISVAEIYRIANQISATYRDAGYIITRAIVPAQRIGDDGAVRIQVVEGFISTISVEGLPEGNSGRIEKMLGHIRGERPLNVKTLERYLLLANDLAGVELESVLRPAADEIGAAELAVAVSRDMADGYLSYDNRGSKLLGPGQFELGGFLNSPLELDGIFGGRLVVASPISELMYGEVTYGQPIGSDGLRLNFSYLRARTAPSGALKQLEIEGTSEEGSVALEYPLIRSRLENLRLGIRFAARHSKTESIGNTVLAADDLRVLSVGVTYDWFDAWRGINLVSIGASKGLDMLGASDRTDPNLSRTGGRADFTKLYGELSRLQDVGAGVSVLVAGAFQYTNEALLASEEFGAGGDRFGRGYDPSEISGDQGAGFSIEFRHDTDLNIPYVDSLQPYAFFDTAAVWDNEINAADRRTLASAGLGVRVEVADRFNGFIEIAQPIEPAVATRGDEDPRLFGGISVRF